MYESQIEAGMEWLDSVFGDWSFDIDSLDMNNIYHCVLAQAAGMDYYSACRHFNLSNEDQINLGFTVPIVNDEDKCWENLKAEWLEVF